MTAPFTLQMLVDAGACSDQVALFNATFGDSVNVTVARAVKVAGLFNWGFGRRFLDAEGREEYDRQHAPILAEYDRQHAPIWAEYDRQRTPIWAEYDRQRTPIWAEYDRQIAPIWAEYDRQHAPILAEYQRQIAPILAEYQRQIAPIWAAAYIATCKRKGKA